jgi:hypothetical protein
MDAPPKLPMDSAAVPALKQPLQNALESITKPYTLQDKAGFCRMAALMPEG